MNEARGRAETLIDRLLGRLRRQLLWDALLMVSPPAVVFSLIVAALYHPVQPSGAIVLFSGSAAAGFALLVGFFRLRAAALSLRFAARLLDEKAGGKERFVTLATANLSLCPPSLVSRLREEAAAFAERLELKRDFPYRVKRSFAHSLIASLSLLLLFLFLQQIGPGFAPSGQPGERLLSLAQGLSRVPRFAPLALELQTLAARMSDPGLSDADKRALIQQAMARVQQEAAAEPELSGAEKDMLSQTGNALRGLEQEQENGQGSGGQKDQMSAEGKGGARGSGKEGQGTEKGSQDSGSGEKGSGQGSSTAVSSSGSQQGEANQGEGQRPDRKGEGAKDQSGGQKDSSGKEKSGDLKGGAEASKWGQGSQNPGEDIPRGRPAERFLKPGEQGGSIKGERFVTVQLPEGEVASEGGVSRSGKGGEIGPKAPVSNIPLRGADSPQSAPQKQPLPLEYRGLIR